MGRTGANRNVDKEEDQLHAKVKNLVSQICSSEEFINKLSESISEAIKNNFEEEFNELKMKSKQVELTQFEHRKMINSLTEKCEAYEKYIRRRTLRIFGLKEVNGDSDMKIALDLFKQKMDVDLDNTCVENCYRIGKSNTNKIRPLVIEFSNIGSKNLVYSKKKNLKGSDVVIREDLSQYSMELLKATLKKVGEDGMVWTNFGKIYAKYKGEEEIIHINTPHDIEKLE